MTLTEALKVNGKARHDSMPPEWYVKVSPCGRKLIGENKASYDMHIITILDENWVPYVKPCKHEPKLISQIVAIPFVGIRETDVFVFECKHCDTKIKAMEWVENK